MARFLGGESFSETQLLLFEAPRLLFNIFRFGFEGLLRLLQYLLQAFHLLLLFLHLLEHLSLLRLSLAELAAQFLILLIM